MEVGIWISTKSKPEGQSNDHKFLALATAIKEVAKLSSEKGKESGKTSRGKDAKGNLWKYKEPKDGASQESKVGGKTF